MHEKTAEIAEKAIEYIGTHPDAGLSVESLSRAMGYSPSGLHKVFKRATGKGVLPHLLEFRMRKAKKLLAETRLSIAEVALELGFSSQQNFATAFRKSTGIAPTAFRTAARDGVGSAFPSAPTTYVAKAESVLTDHFETPTMQAHWKSLSGEWQQRKGLVAGQGPNEAVLMLDRPLPENFRIALEFCFPEDTSEPAGHFALALHGRDGIGNYFRFIVGSEGNAVGELRRHGLTAGYFADVVVVPRKWQHVELELKDDTVRVLLDHSPAATYRDPFPVAYARKCKFSFGTWQNSVRVRNFRLVDLGFAALVSPVRQGDSLYANRFYQEALSFYLRCLKSESLATDVMELRYKTSMCYFRLGEFLQARAWAAKVITTPATDFWSRQTRICELEMGLAIDGPAGCARQFRVLYRESETRSGLLNVASRQYNTYTQTGHFGKAVLLLRMQVEEAPAESYEGLRCRALLSGTELYLRRFREAESEAKVLLRNPRATDLLCIQVLRVLFQVKTCEREWREAKACLARIAGLARSAYDKAWVEVHTGMLLRGQKRFAEALELLRGLPDWTPPDLAAYAKILVAWIVCGFGKPADAAEAIEVIGGIKTFHSYNASGTRSGLMYPPRLRQGEYAGAAEVLLADANHGDDRTALHAEQGVKAGIMQELGGDSFRARETWEWVRRRFPQPLANYFDELAQALIKGQLDILSDMPFPAQKRSEMFLLVGLLLRKRGVAEEAKQWLQRSYEEDGTMSWAAMLAERELA